VVLGIAVAQLGQQAALDALQHLRVALAEGFAGGQGEGAARAFGQAQQAPLHRRRQLAGTQRQRGRLVGEGVDHVCAIGAGQAVVQGQERPLLNGVHAKEGGKGVGWRDARPVRRHVD